MTKEIIQTNKAPKPIGTYSQAVKVDHTIYLSGQIPLVPETMTIIEGDITAQITQVFENLKAVAEASGGDLSDIVKLNVFLTDLSNFPLVNEIMGRKTSKPGAEKTCMSGYYFGKPRRFFTCRNIRRQNTCCVN